MSVKRKAPDATTGDAKKQKGIASFFGAPKAVPHAPMSVSGAGGEESLPALKWDKTAWVEKLTGEQKELLQLEIDTLDETWLKELRETVLSSDFLDLKRFLKKELGQGKKIFPPVEDVYSWSRHTPLNTVKAVILGQDPYHNVNQAHGLSFSVRPPTVAPPSLKNIYKALKNDYPLFVPPPNNQGLLTPWADRGVLLLNTCLTVRAHEANSHSNRGWEKFTQKVIDTVAAKRTNGVVFLAWGSPAGKRVVKIDKKRHLVLMSVHPSPLSASRGWFNCGHFVKTNDWLQERYGPRGRIDWALTEGSSVFGGDGGEENEREEGAVKGQGAPVHLPTTAKPVDVETVEADKVEEEKKAILKQEIVEKNEATIDEFDDEEDALAAMQAFEAEEAKTKKS